VVVSGQVGLDKKPVLQRVVDLAAQRNHPVELFNVGDMMYAEGPDIAPGRILDIPRQRLESLRRSVFKDILARADKVDNLIVNTHAAFRWKHGLFPAFDHDQMLQLDADLYITLVDNVDAVHERLTHEHEIRHSLKDILVWREEELLATEVLANILRGHGCFYVVSRSAERDTAESIYRLMFEPYRRKVYPSFPMTHVMDMPEVLAEINWFRDTLAEHFITFDPGDVDEKRLLSEAADARRRRENTIQVQANNRAMRFDVDEINRIAGDIDGQIYARDFKLIEQSDMICSYIPEMPNGKPGLSSGVERELQHAFESTKEVYVVWRASAEPSPFVSETATRIFASINEALAYFRSRGDIREYQLPLKNP
jgi:adenylate kinase